MKYYAVTDDPRELYHYGVKGMKWGQHIFGPEPGLKKSQAYLNAQKKLKALSAKAGKATVSLGKSIKKSAVQKAYNRRAKQQERFEKSVQKAQDKADRVHEKFEAFQAKKAETAVTKQLNKAIRKVKIANAKENIANTAKNIGEAAKKVPGQIAYNVRRAEENKYNKAVKKAQDRNRLSETLRSLDREEKIHKQVDRERKMEDLREKQRDIIADNDLKTLRQNVQAEKRMPKYYQEARVGAIKYSKLSDEQIGRIQNRLALEASTNRFTPTEQPSWRDQKKAARRKGYLEGISKGTSAAMEEVARAGVQYGIKGLMNKKKLDSASAHKAEREKEASRIKNQKTRKEMREDLRQETYEAQIKAGVGALHRGTTLSRASKAAERLQEAKRIQNENQGKLDEAREERKFLMDERHNATKAERQRQERLAEASNDADEIGKSLHENGYAIIPNYTKDGKKAGFKVLSAEKTKDKDGNTVIADKEAAAYLKLYESKKQTPDRSDSSNNTDSNETVSRAEQERQHAEERKERIADERRHKEMAKESERHAEANIRYTDAQARTKRAREIKQELSDIMSDVRLRGSETPDEQIRKQQLREELNGILSAAREAQGSKKLSREQRDTLEQSRIQAEETREGLANILNNSRGLSDADQRYAIKQYAKTRQQQIDEGRVSGPPSRRNPLGYRDPRKPRRNRRS